MNSSLETVPGFVQFIDNRECARRHRECLKLPRYLWSTDPVIQKFRFCNVNREDDTVTRWIEANVRKPLHGASKAVLVVNVFLARVFNQPTSLEVLGLVTGAASSMSAAEARITRYQRDGNKIMRGAYMMGAHGPKNKGRGVVEYYFSIARRIWSAHARLNQAQTLGDVAAILRDGEGIGAFVANQVVTDLRYTPQFECASDWSSFLLCGPGTRRGLNILAGRPVRQALGEETSYLEVIALRKQVLQFPRIEVLSLQPTFDDPNNLSNCLCEFDKYVRASYILEGKENGGMSRMRIYS